MTQPTRWLDDNGTSAEIRELIRAGSRPPRFPKLALAAAIIPMAQKAALASTWSLPATAIVAAKATSVGLVIGLGSIAAVTTLSGPATTKHTNVQSASTRQVAVTSTGKRGVAPSNRELPQQATRFESGSVDTAKQDVPLAAAALQPGPSLNTLPKGIAAEAQLLERARALLDESPTRALLLTNEHRSRFAPAQMSAERELIAIDALVRLGRSREAELRARPFLADGAGQIFAQRVRNLLDRHAQ